MGRGFGEVLMFALRPSVKYSFLVFLSLSMLIFINFTTPSKVDALTNSNCNTSRTGTLAATGVVSGDYCNITFTSGTGNWIVPGDLSIEVAVVGGGGGGGFGSNGGGGGAGEVLVTGSASISGGNVINTSAIQVSSGESISISIGGGGISGAPTGSTASDATTAWNNNSGTSRPGGNGGATSFGSITATGGGGGGGNTRVAGADGGSGGGGATGGAGGLAGTNAPPNGWTSFRNAGSAGGTGSGGGAGGAGSTKGGIGVTVFGKKVAGGGGGWGKLGAENSLTDLVLGGNGRLTTGTWPYAGTPPNYTSEGVATTGSGGGAGAPGGRGVVIVRYTPILITPTIPSANPTTGTLKSIAVSWAGVSNASSYTLKLYASDGTTLLHTITGITSTSRTITTSDYASLADDTTYQVSITAIGNGSTFVDSSESSKISATTHTPVTVNISSEFINPYSTRSIRFDLTFSENVTGFSVSNLALSGTSTGWTLESLSGSGRNYSIIATNSNPPDGTVELSIDNDGVSATATGVVGPSVLAPAVNIGRTVQVTRWLKFLWGESLVRF